MSELARYGDGDEGKLLDNVTVDADPAIVATHPAGLQRVNGVSLCLFSDVNAGVLDEDYLPIALDGDLAGTWQVLVSNDYVPAGQGSYGAVEAAGRWVDITSQFSPTIATVDPGTYATTAQYVQASPLDARTIMVIFRRSAGTGEVSAQFYNKSQG